MYVAILVILWLLLCFGIGYLGFHEWQASKPRNGNMTFLMGGPLDSVDVNKTKYGEPPEETTDIHIPDSKHEWIFHHYKLEKRTPKDRYFAYVTSYDRNDPSREIN